MRSDALRLPETLMSAKTGSGKSSTYPSHATRLAACSLAILLCACSTQTAITNANEKIANTRRVTEELNAHVKAQAANAAVVRHKGPRLHGAEVPTVDTAKNLPPALRAPFPYRSAVQDFEGVLADISRATGLSVRKTTRAQTPATNSGQPSAAAQGASNAIGYTWSGDLSGFLDLLARSNDLYWRFEARSNEVVFFREDTRTFSVFLPTGENQVAASIALAGAGGTSSATGSRAGSSGAGSAGGSGGGSSGNVSVSGSMTINAFDSVVQSVRGFVQAEQPNGLSIPAANSNVRGSSIQGTGVVANEGLGMITVTATPPTLDKVARYIEYVNSRFARNVLVGVKIYRMTVNDEAVNGVSIRAALANAAGSRSVDFVPSGMSTPNSGTASQLSFKLSQGASTAEIMLQALRSLGDVTDIQSTSVITANGQAAPFQVAEDVTYTESNKTTVVPNVGVSNELISATRTVGLTGNFVPRILDDNRIFLDYQLNISSMTLSEFRSGNASVQNPRIARQALKNNAYLDDGETLVLFGYEQRRNVSDSATGFLTLTQKGGNSRTMIVIVLDVYGDAKAKPMKEAPRV